MAYEILKLDFSNIPDSFIPEGEYNAVLVKVVVKESKAGSQYLNWEFDISDPEHTGHKVWMMTSLTPKAMWKVKETFTTLGLATETLELTVTEEGVVTQPALWGVPVLLNVTVEEYNGRKSNRVESIIRKLPSGRMFDGDLPELD